MRIALFGSGSPMSAAALRALAPAHDVAMIVSPSAPLGLRGLAKKLLGRLPPTPLAATARDLRKRVVPYDPSTLAQSLRTAGVELIAIASFQAILPQSVLAVPAINLHPSLLPLHRGIDPLFWTYHADDRVTGNTVHWVEGGVDAGDVIEQESMPLARGRDILDLYTELSDRGAALLTHAVTAIGAGAATRTPQDGSRATHEPAPAKGTWRVEFDKWPAERTWHFLSGVCSMYGAMCRDPRGEALPIRAALSYEERPHGREPGTVERGAGDRATLCCPDGTVEVIAPVPQSAARR